MYTKHWRGSIIALREFDYTKYALIIIIYKKQSSENGYVQNPVILSKKKKIFSPSDFFMHMFTRFVTCMQNIEGIQRMLWEEFITQNMSKFKTLSFYQKNIFSASNFFMHMFTRSLVCTQNIEEIQFKLWEELITQSMHYQPLFTGCGLQKISKFNCTPHLTITQCLCGRKIGAKGSVLAE